MCQDCLCGGTGLLEGNGSCWKLCVGQPFFHDLSNKTGMSRVTSDVNILVHAMLYPRRMEYTVGASHNHRITEVGNDRQGHPVQLSTCHQYFLTKPGPSVLSRKCSLQRMVIKAVCVNHRIIEWLGLEGAPGIIKLQPTIIGRATNLLIGTRSGKTSQHHWIALSEAI